MQESNGSTKESDEKSLERVPENCNLLSEYAEQLDLHVRKRYLQKISVIGIDPVLIPEEKLEPECLPPVEAADLLSFLVLETTDYTKDQVKLLKAFKLTIKWYLDLLLVYKGVSSLINMS